MTSCDKFSYFEYSNTYDRVAYLKQLAKIKVLELNGIIQKNKIVLNEYEFEIFIDKLEDINAIKNDDKALIHYVCQYGTVQMLKCIISRGANLECADRNGDRPIHYVCQYGNIEMFRCIVDNGAYLVPANKSGTRPIHVIGRYGTADMLNYMIARGVSLEYFKNGNCDRLIHIICRYGSIDMLAAVIKLVDLWAVSYEMLQPPHRVDVTDERCRLLLDKANKGHCGGGITPLEIAELYKREPEFLALLQSK
jgi:ankyrin repeat protein